MNDYAERLAVVLPWCGAALLIALDVALVVALTSVTALSPVALRRISVEGGRRTGFVENLKRPDSSYRVAAYLLERICLLGATTLVALALRVSGVRLPAVAAFATVALIGVLGLQAIVARSFALWRPRQALPATLWSVRLAHGLLFPFVYAIQSLHTRIHNEPNRTDEEREEEQDEEVEALIEVGERSGLLEKEEGKMMRGIVDLDETLVREIMTPRTAIVALPEDATVAQARGRVLEAGHSRLPVFRETIDNIVGFLHSRDLFQAWEAKEEEQTIASYLRPAVFVPETLSAGDLLAEMRQKTQIAMVVDEYGGIAGLITLEDVLEEIVGDIRDEHDVEEDLLHEESDGCWIVDASAHVAELEERFDVDFPDRDYDTVGGLVVSSFGRVPRVGEVVESHGLTLEVLMADHRRVRRVRVRRPPSDHEASRGA